MEIELVAGDQINYEVLEMVFNTRKQTFGDYKDSDFNKRIKALHKRALQNVLNKKNEETFKIINDFEILCKEWIGIEEGQSFCRKAKESIKIPDDSYFAFLKTFQEVSE